MLEALKFEMDPTDEVYKWREEQTNKAINQAAAGQAAKEGAAGEFLSEVIPSGSIFWGSFLVALGFLLILANFDVILYDTLFNFWPVPIIVIGIKLILDYFAKAKNGQ